MAPPHSPAPSTVSATMLKVISTAAGDDDLHLFKELVTMVDEGRGRPKEAIEALRLEDVEELKGLGVLHTAASKGSLEVCRYLVEELQVDVNGVDKEGRTPLFFAIICKGVGTPKYLLDHGADPNKASHDGSSPLHAAAKSGDCETIELLLLKGAYVDPVAFCGTPLHCAATEDHYSAMKILLDHNADCNKMVNGKTPLIAAIDAAARNCMVLLVRAGADRKESLAYAMANLHSEKLVSTDFVNCVMEDVASNNIVIDNDEPVSKKKIRAAGFKKLASHSFHKKDYSAAIGNYTVAMALDPDDATLYSNRSVCWLLVGEAVKALADANQCRKLWPDWPKACYRQGAAVMLLKDYKSACDHFLDGLKLDPANTEMEDALRNAYDAMAGVSKHQG
ncbi:unnamed protein product [Alopecurus aequalis]